MCEDGVENTDFWDDDSSAIDEKCKADDDPRDDVRDCCTVDLTEEAADEITDDCNTRDDLLVDEMTDESIWTDDLVEVDAVALTEDSREAPDENTDTEEACAD